MRHALFAALALLAATSASAALSPATEAFLQEIGYNVQSPEIALIADDTITTKSGLVVTLNTLAAKRDEVGVRRFVVTRNFVKAYMKDTQTPFPDREFYYTTYLKSNEVSFILAALKKPFTLA